MQNVAEMTGGKYFRATDEKKLKEIYASIDQMEKTLIEVTQHSRKHEEYFWLAAIGLGLIGLEFLFRLTIFRTVP